MELTAFADGDVWRARLCTDVPGAWRWRTPNGQGGTLDAEPRADNWTESLRLSADGRYFVQANGRPWFWLGDTAWSIVFKGQPDEWSVYLDRRAAQGYSLLQVTLLPWRWEYTDAEGNRPFIDGDPSHPNERYFRRYDQFLHMAAERGLVVCLMLIWGGPRELLPAIHFSQEQAVEFARYAVARYAPFPTVWSISGDAEYVREIEKWNAVGTAVEASDPYARPTTNHLPPSMNWVGVHADAPWHDFHMFQTGHYRASASDIADLPAAYDRGVPRKPFINGEPWYEAHPARDTAEYGPVFTPADVGYAFWVSILSGSSVGHSYGSQGIWNWKRRGDSEQEVAGPQIGPLWTEALEHPGAEHCGLGARFLRSVAWWRLRPAPERVELDPTPLQIRRPFCAIVDSALWIVYVPTAEGKLLLKGLAPLAWQAAWLDPRTGEQHVIGAVQVGLTHRWQAPAAPTTEDWVLVLTAADDVYAATSG
jgi:hypothetical protein